jgi:hypothetical protein
MEMTSLADGGSAISLATDIGMATAARGARALARAGSPPVDS